MRVFVNGRFLAQRITGIQRYARETLASVDTLVGEQCPSSSAAVVSDWVVLAPSGTPRPDLRHIGFQTVGRLRGHLWEQLELPWHAQRGLLFSFGTTGPLLCSNQVITIHDANVVRMPESFGLAFRLWYRFLLPRLAVRCRLVMTVSQFSASEAIECYGASPDRIRVTTEGWQHIERVSADDSIIDRLSLRGRRFALAVSSPSPNKNFGAITRALHHLGADAPPCVVVGQADSRVFGPATRNSPSLLSAGYVSDAELKALYGHATCFVFPSFYEGFGIPPLEAMACGCPVLASTAPAIREVCADAALYFDPGRADELAAHLRLIFSDDSVRAKMASAGSVRASLFSWEQAARLNVTAISELG